MEGKERVIQELKTESKIKDEVIDNIKTQLESKVEKSEILECLKKMQGEIDSLSAKFDHQKKQQFKIIKPKPEPAQEMTKIRQNPEV